MMNTGTYGFNIAGEIGEIDNVKIEKSTNGIYMYWPWVHSDVEFRNMEFKGNTYIAWMRTSSENVNAKLINSTSDSWNIHWTNVSGTANKLYRQYTFNLKVVDRDGNPISNATVVINEQDGTEVFSGTTDANGDITQQDLKYKTYVSSTTTTHTPHTITISKTGYKTKVIKYTMDRKREEIEVLENRREV